MNANEIVKIQLKNIDHESYKFLVANFYEIMNKIESGIELKNGKRRNFDILDYMDNSALEFVEYLNLIQLDQSIKKEDFEIFFKFMHNYKEIEGNVKKTKLISIFYRPDNFKEYKLDPETKIKVNFKKVNNKYKLIKENRIFPENEIQEIFDHIEDSGHPLNRLTYNAVMNRMKTNTFKKDKNIPIEYILTDYEKIRRDCVDEDKIEPVKQMVKRR
jgi:hypothetical protein